VFLSSIECLVEGFRPSLKLELSEVLLRREIKKERLVRKEKRREEADVPLMIKVTTRIGKRSPAQSAQTGPRRCIAFWWFSR